MSNSAAINGKLSALSARSGFHLVSSQTSLPLLGEINKPVESKAQKVKLQHSNLQKMYIVCVLCHRRNMRPKPEFPHFRLWDFSQTDCCNSWAAAPFWLVQGSSPWMGGREICFSNVKGGHRGVEFSPGVQAAPPWGSKSLQHDKRVVWSNHHTPAGPAGPRPPTPMA